jgi:hypothetical protein
LGPGDSAHVTRPDGSGGAHLAERIKAGFHLHGVVGPVGSGKSTELAAAAAALQNEFVACLARVGRSGRGAGSSVDRILDQISLALALLVEADARFQLSSTTRKWLSERVNYSGSAFWRPTAWPMQKAAEDVLRSLIRELGPQSPGGRVVLLVDGLERTPPGDLAPLLEALLAFREDASLVLVLPYAVVAGPPAHEVVSQVRVFPVPAVPVWREDGEAAWRPGRQFLREIAARRLGVSFEDDPGLLEVMDHAAFWSGGVPRVFLQILRDAAGYATLGQRSAIVAEDIANALRDQQDALRRVLQQGDMDVLRAADGTDGIEAPLEQRVRFLSHGLLLEYWVSDPPIVRAAPLVARLLRPSEVRP